VNEKDRFLGEASSDEGSFAGSNPTPNLDCRLVSSLFQLKNPDLRCCGWGMEFEHTSTSRNRSA
jgi:hypothetical protein